MDNVSNMSGDVNNLYARIIFYLEQQKVRVISAAMFQKGRKSQTTQEVAEDFCKNHGEIFRASETLAFLNKYCKDSYQIQIDTLKSTQVLSEAQDPGFYSQSRAQDRATQLFFCDSMKNRGYILDLAKDTKDYLVSEKPHSLDIFRKDLSILGEDAYPQWASRNLIVGAYHYKPWGDILSQNKSKVYLLNTYNKPYWHDKLKQPRSWEELPETLRCFYLHLFPEQEQRTYALNWLACSIQASRQSRDKPKLSTYLCLIGKPGVGKGVCIEHHLRYLHGTLNYMEDKTRSIGEKFSVSAYLAKTLIHFSEASIVSEEAYDALKALESVWQGVEAKNLTAELHQTYFNIVWACNHKNRMRYLDPEDRRFSFLDVTEDVLVGKKIQDPITGNTITYTREEINYLCNDPRILVAFAEHLLSLEPNFDLAETPLKDTMRYREVMRESRPLWVGELLDALMEIDWGAPFGNDSKLGYKEVERSTDANGYYTYQVPAASVMRIINKATPSRKSISIPKYKIQEEFKKLPKEDVHSYVMDGVWTGVRIRHPQHESCLVHQQRLIEERKWKG